MNPVGSGGAPKVGLRAADAARSGRFRRLYRRVWRECAGGVRSLDDLRVRQPWGA